MSDIEIDNDQDDCVIQFGEQQEFDPTTGMPIGSSSSSSSVRGSDLSGITAGPVDSSRTETWMHTLAEKNQNNTFDIKAPHMLGIDEAGRGPVLGSMVYGVCWAPIEKLEELKSIKVAGHTPRHTTPHHTQAHRERTAHDTNRNHICISPTRFDA